MSESYLKKMKLNKDEQRMNYKEIKMKRNEGEGNISSHFYHPMTSYILFCDKHQKHEIIFGE